MDLLRRLIRYLSIVYPAFLSGEKKSNIGLKAFRKYYLLILFLCIVFFSASVNGQSLQQLTLNLKNEAFTDQTLFLFHANGLTGSDPFDGLKLSSLSPSFAEIYSQDATTNNLSINTLPENLQEVIEFPVFIRSTVSDTFTVSVTKFENIQPNWIISLVNLSTKDTLLVNSTTSTEVIHTGAFQSGVLNVQHFTLIINPGIVTQQSSITGTPGKDGWRFLGSSYSNISYAQLLDSIWTQGATSSDDPSGPPNIFTWSELNQTFEAITNLDDVPGTGNGFIAYLYEDNDPSTSNVDGGWPKSFYTSGIAGFGTINFPITYTSGADTSLNGFNLVANPYPFSIDWNALSGWSKSNMQDAIWIWDSNANNGNGDYLEHISGVGDPINIIAPHQAFWIRTENTNPVLVADESVRSSGGNLLKKRSTTPVLTLKVKSKDFDFEDTFYLSFRENRAASPHSYSMSKLLPISQNYLNIYSLFRGEKLAINNFQADFTRLEIPIQIDHSLSGDFVLSVKNSNPFSEDIDIWLLDEKYKRLVGIDTFNNYAFHSDSGTYDFTLILEKAISISNDIEMEIPEHTQLLQNYPNPFNSSTIIEFKVPETVLVTLEIFDTMGRRIATLLNGEAKSEGIHKVTFDASSLSSGIYTYRLLAGSKILIKRLTLIK